MLVDYQEDVTRATRYQVGLGLVARVYPKERVVDLVDILDDSYIKRALLVGPETPPEFATTEEATKKNVPQSLCVYVYTYGQRSWAVAWYVNSLLSDEDNENEFRLCYSIAGFTFTIDKTGRTMVVTQTKDDGSAGPPVTMDGDHVIIGDTATAKKVSRKGDGVAINTNVPPGNVIVGTCSGTTPPGGPCTITVTNHPFTGEISEGSDILKTT